MTLTLHFQIEPVRIPGKKLFCQRRNPCSKYSATGRKSQKLLHEKNYAFRKYVTVLLHMQRKFTKEDVNSNPRPVRLCNSTDSS
jgi:hypothetical protein